jgi:valyl-tRNA synthetase
MGITMSSAELSKTYEPADVEARWSKQWVDAGLFVATADSKKPPFSIVLPPPNVTGSLHLGHALTATIQDVLTRYKRMKGFNCLWLPGTDHAGIATQMVVERELMRTEKKTRHDLGREEFLKRVWSWKEQYGARIGEQHKLLGASLDWSRERFTMDSGVSEAVKEVFVRLYNDGLLYRANRLINWDPVLLTALSDLEVENEETNGTLWSIAYPVEGSTEKLVVATTRPETMLGDTAVAVHPDDNRYQHLIGKHVVLPLIGRRIPIIGDAELVDPAFGTGVVKVTPAHDHNDYQTGLRHRLPMINIFTETAVVNENGGPYRGLERFAARKRVLEDLKAQELLVEEKPHKLPLAKSQRSGVPVEPRLSPQWYVKTKPLAEKALKAVAEGRTQFVPDPWTATFNRWLENIQDWCVSRQLWWGHQIPAWFPVGPDGTVDFEKSTPVVAKEPPREGQWVQDPDVLDTWFSSALWPFSTLGWPDLSSKDLKAWYPNSVMETGHDIIFFWVARMMMMGLHFMDEVPFRTVYLHAMVRDEKGEKMSKTKGNVIDPLDIIQGAPPERLPASIKNKYPKGLEPMGADALRFTLAALTQQGRDIKLSIDRIAGYKAFCNKVWNAARFALMNLGDFREDGRLFITERALSLADRWILSRLNRAVAETTEAIERYAFSEAASTLYQFLWGAFCDWYIELAKGALYGTDETARTSTRATLVFCLDHVMRLLHPFAPFITEEIWQKLPLAKEVSGQTAVSSTERFIMQVDYPTPDDRLFDSAAEETMAPLMAAIEGIRTIRGESNLAPSLRIEARIQSDDVRIRQTLESHRAYVLTLAGLSKLAVEPLGFKPPQAAAEIGKDMEIFVPLAGLVDLAEERERLKKEIAKSDAETAQINKKFDNPNYASRAPAEVVEKDRARIAELTQRVAKLRDNLERIAPVEFRVAPPSAGAVNLGDELKTELSEVSLAMPDDQVKEALDKLREGTKEGLSAQDHRDLGVAYMNMGLVDEAVREFNAANENTVDGAPSHDAKKRPKKAVQKVESKSAQPKSKAKAASKAKTPSAKTKKVASARNSSTPKSGAWKATASQKKTSKKEPSKKTSSEKKASVKRKTTARTRR